MKPQTFSVGAQTLSLMRRYCIRCSRSPISSLIRILAWPALLLGVVVWLVWFSEEAIAMEVGGYYMTLCLMFSVYPQLYNICVLLIDDKSTEFKSLMISMGLRKSSYYLANSIILILLVSIPTLVVTCLAVTKIYPLASPVAVVLFYIIFAIHLNGYILALSSLVTSNTYTALIFTYLAVDVMGLIDYLVKLAVRNLPQDQAQLVIFMGSLSPFESLQVFQASYATCKGLCSSFQMGSDKDVRAKGLYGQPFYLLLIAMLVWTTISHLFAFWFDEVCPWKTDSAIRRWCFCLQKRSRPKHALEDTTTNDSPYFEKPLGHREVGILISGIKKFYNRTAVVDNLSFKIYKGETTLLLGHNGAGKTTLMNMILRRLEPDEGTIVTSKLDSVESHEVSSSVGVCPQESIVDESLTVKQHLRLFCDIKASRLPPDVRNAHLSTTVTDVGLMAAVDKLPSELSGGMKRKLSLGMAFVGYSSILVLDEPSSGLDPDSRVFVWDVIRRYRADRTVLLSTQHMEEADYLGDRVAIMSAGQIICCGSSLFLNNLFGKGYKLRIECQASKRRSVLDTIRGFFPNSKLSESDSLGVVQSATTSSPSLRRDPIQDMLIELNEGKGSNAEAKMVELLRTLENKSPELGIKSHSLKSSSIEDVMLQTNKILTHRPIDRRDSTQLILTNTSGHIQTLAKPMRDPDPRFSTMLGALLTKNEQTYENDWMAVLLYRGIFVMIGGYVVVQQMHAPNTNGFYFVALIAHYVNYPCLERVSRFKAVQLTSYANYFCYWLSFYLSDLTTIIYSILISLVFLHTWPGHTFIFKVGAVQASIAVGSALFLLGTAGAFLAYILSHCFNDSSNAIGFFALVCMANNFAQTGLFLVSTMIFKSDTAWATFRKVVDYFFLALLPTEAYARVNKGFWSQCIIDCRYPRPFADGQCDEKCDGDELTIGLTILAAQAIVYGAILLLVEAYNIDLGFFLNWRNIFRCARGGQATHPIEVDNDVTEEANKARLVISSPPRDTYALVACDLRKSYVRGEPVVDNLSFTVNCGECLGLLGVNGAGKTTTFSMLVAESSPDQGLVWQNGLYSNGNLSAYRRKIGFDPQASPETFLTPAQALSLMAVLRGLNKQSVLMLVNSVLEVLEMSEHAHKVVKHLSGGTKRKLSLGLSLIGNPNLVVLDEPTAGVDPMARRSIWQLLRTLRAQSGVSIIISSHAMEECEAICDRISIMARGRLRCIGSFLRLRQKFAQGCTIRVRYNPAIAKAATTSSPRSQGSRGSSDSRRSSLTGEESFKRIVEELAQRLAREIGPSARLVDSNAQGASFSVSDKNVRRSMLFSLLAECKRKHPQIDYVVNDSSLEDIFIALAREQEQGFSLSSNVHLPADSASRVSSSGGGGGRRTGAQVPMQHYGR